MATPAPTDELMRPDDLAAMLGKTRAAVSQWRVDGIGPKYVKLGQRVYYRRSDIDAWIESNAVGTIHQR